MTGAGRLGTHASRAKAMAAIAASRKTVFLAFTDVTESDLERLAQATSKAEVKGLLKDCMKIDQAEGYRMEILAEMHCHNYSFCVSHGFTPVKTSTLLSIMKLVLQEAVSKRPEVDDAFDICKWWLLKHGVERPPWSVGVFSFDDVRDIIGYVHNTFFRHYKLYMYAFMPHCDLSFCVESPGGAVAPPTMRVAPLLAADEVDPRWQPEFVHLFRPTDAELAEQESRRARERDQAQDERTARVKQKVDEGVQKLVDAFKEKLKEQDQRFHKMLEES